MRRVDARAGLIIALVAATPFVGVQDARAEAPIGVDWIAHQPGVEIAVSAAALGIHTTGFIPQQKSAWGPSWERKRHEAYGVASDLTGALLGSSWQMAVAYALDVEYFDRHGVENSAEAAGRTTIVDLRSDVLATGISILFKRTMGVVDRAL